MRTETREMWNTVKNDVAKVYTVDDLSVPNDANIKQEQRIAYAVEEDADFLKKENITPVNDQSDTKLGFGVAE